MQLLPRYYNILGFLQEEISHNCIDMVQTYYGCKKFQDAGEQVHKCAHSEVVTFKMLIKNLHI